MHGSSFLYFEGEYMGREPFSDGSTNERRAREQYERRNGIAKKDKPEKFDPITTGVKTRKAGLGRKISDVFIANDPVVVSEYVFDRILVPSLQDLMLDIVWGGLSMLFRGGELRAPKSGRRGSFYHDAYDNRNSSRNGLEKPNRGPERPSRGRRIDELEFDDRAEAEEVLEKVCDMMDEYGNVSIGDVFDLCDIDHSSTDLDWGWNDEDLSRMRVERLGRGYYTIYFPKARRL